MAEEYSGGKQAVRVRVWPKFSSLGLLLSLLCFAFGSAAAFDQAWTAATIFGAIAAGLGALLLRDSAGATATVDRSLTQRSEEHTSELQSRLHLVCRLLLEKKKHHEDQ